MADPKLEAKRLRQEEIRRLARQSHPLRWKRRERVRRPNTLFSKQEVKRLRGHIQRMVRKDQDLLARLSEARIGGVRDWEYGTLLGALMAFPERSGWGALDVGSGNSTFPRYLVESGNCAHMTTLDLEYAFEKQKERTRVRDEEAGITRVEGSMLDLPFEDASFDLVTCISAIEHLDGSLSQHLKDPEANPHLPYDDYLERTRTAVREMARVVRPGGVLYLTSDLYLADRQTTDAWAGPGYDGPIWSAYRYDDFDEVFVQTLRASGLELWGEPADHRPELLAESEDRASYRGRYFTVFALLARRPGG